MTCSEGVPLLGGDFHGVLEKIEIDVFQITKKWHWE